MDVVITRAVQDAEPLKTRVEELGCRVMLAPLIETVANDIAEDTFASATALIATSRNALVALAASPALLSATKMPLYVVGPGTAAIAQGMGFERIIEGPGRVEGLVPILAADNAAGQRLIYLRGDVLAFDLEAAMAETGVNVVPVLAYRSVAAETLPAYVIKALQTASIDAVTLMSPRTARIWSRLVATLSPPVQLSGVTYLCLSERVGEALGPVAKADKILVSSQPNLEEMLALVKRLAASSKAE
jgi:uroporphyrinogen-III synthase